MFGAVNSTGRGLPDAIPMCLKKCSIGDLMNREYFLLDARVRHRQLLKCWALTQTVCEPAVLILRDARYTHCERASLA